MAASYWNVNEQDYLGSDGSSRKAWIKRERNVKKKVEADRQIINLG